MPRSLMERMIPFRCTIRLGLLALLFALRFGHGSAQNFPRQIHDSATLQFVKRSAETRKPPNDRFRRRAQIQPRNRSYLIAALYLENRRCGCYLSFAEESQPEKECPRFSASHEVPIPLEAPVAAVVRFRSIDFIPDNWEP
jgi:hypothetical protein